MRPFGILIIAALLLAPLALFAPLSGQHDPIAVFSQYIGSTALIAMGISQVLATRWPGLQTLFGGYDRIYILHKWLGIGALGAVLLHDTIDADIRGLGRETLLVDVAETLGEISLYTLLVLVVITIVTIIPYHLWRWTHRLMGAVFVMSAFHFVFILKPFSVADPLGLYVLAFCLIGTVAYLYTLLPDAAVRLPHRYVVDRVEPTGDALAVTMKPVGRGVGHRAGQFAFIRFDQSDLSETHPFTISSAPNDERSLRFTVKPLGDYTARLRRGLEVGAGVQVSRAFGHFHPGGGGPQIWIAGGIGVTPFVAWTGAMSGDGGPVHLFYCVPEQPRAAHLDELEVAARSHDRLKLHLIESRTGDRLDADAIAALSGVDLRQARVYFCGPKPMRESLRRQLIGVGLPAGRFHNEEFEIRSGIGLGSVFVWLVRRIFGFGELRLQGRPR